MSEQRLFACERCSRRKQRCDRTIPVCQPCQEAQAECTGSASEGTVISGNDRIIARKGPVTRLLEQIEALEEKLRVMTEESLAVVTLLQRLSMIDCHKMLPQGHLSTRTRQLYHTPQA
ncbi:hypothetical protein FCULG_00002736 [Fusarium culmorum]|uniref:Zn(2)-C6 fungal-type domain-containing protein n=1 Tax=Fusarium culmorum TaxID=5516 RepID=A0A2T4H7C5_FUSCU|nr:hypothetical protein FCULG_00002736 [Fusarium culmorum]